MSKEYCCQVFSITGKILETFHENFLEAVRKCTARGANDGIIKASVFHYPDMENPICMARIVL
ncbi:MAG TPA: hypothetical protein VII94_06135 [Candidatus Saccharimonadales bacterium]